MAIDLKEIEKLINEAQGYAVERVNNAIGDTELFNAMLNEYNNYHILHSYNDTTSDK